MVNAPPLLIIGLDGASFNLLDRLSAQGHTPELDRLRATGLSCDLQSTIPPVTLPAWTSFLTGVQPAEHGITDLLYRQGYDLQPMHAGLRTQPTWLGVTKNPIDRASRACILGVPGTYPPETVHGMMVSGFDAPGAHEAGEDAVYPQESYSHLKSLGGWRYAVFNENRSKDPRALAQATDRLVTDIGQKEHVALTLAHQEPWQLFFVHMQASDTAGHHLWHTFDTRSPRFVPGLQDAIPRIYRRLDRFIGRLCRWAEKRGARVLVVSDHGMVGASDIAVHLNRCLQNLGLLHFKRSAPPTLGMRKTLRNTIGRIPSSITSPLRKRLPDIAFSQTLRVLHSSPLNWRNTQAFSFELDYHPSIFLHHLGQFPQSTSRGCPQRLSTVEEAALCDRITDALMALRVPGSTAPVIKRVFRREELTTPLAAHAERLPDLLIEPALVQGYRPCFIPSSGDTGQPIIRFLGPHELNAPRGFGMPGQHRPAGIFMLSGPGIVPEEDWAPEGPLDIATAGSFVAAHRGFPLLRPLPTWLSDTLRPYTLNEISPSIQSKHKTLPSEHPLHNAAFAERLRKLGYLN